MYNTHDTYTQVNRIIATYSTPRNLLANGLATTLICESGARDITSAAASVFATASFAIALLLSSVGMQM